MAGKKRTPARGAGGRFVSSKGKAMVRSSPRTITRTVYRQSPAPAPAPSRAAPRRRGSSSGAMVERGKTLGIDGGIGYGYGTVEAEANKSQGKHWLFSVPSAGGYGRTATIAIGAHLVAANSQGTLRTVMDHLSRSIGAIAGYKIAGRKAQTEKATMEPDALRTTVGEEIDVDVDDLETVRRKLIDQAERRRRAVEESIAAEDRARREQRGEGMRMEQVGEVEGDDFDAELVGEDEI